MQRAFSVLAAVLFCAGAAPPPMTCNMRLAFKQPDNQGRDQRPVWHDAKDTTVLFADDLHVNTDGTKRSYKIDDFWGEIDAINTLCNAMAGYCTDLKTSGRTDRTKVAERISALKTARERDWPADLLAKTKLSPAVIVMKDGKPCAEQDGFLISSTSLQDPKVKDVCDLGKYVDALTVPAIVIPKGSNGFSARNIHVGDLAVVLPRGQTTVILAVVGDTGPVDELGEGTVALARAALNKNADPANYDEVRGRGRYAGKGWEIPYSYVLIFAGTRDVKNPYMTNDRIGSADFKKKFDDWGGIERLTACGTAYDKR